MAPFTTTGTTSHSTNVTGLFTGANTYYAKCQDAADPTKITNACSIVFGVGDDCTSNLQCFGGFQCVNGTCQPPVCGNALPTGALTPGTPSTTISMTTPADATCRYSINSADLYSAMTSFTTTGTTNHSSFVSGLVTGGKHALCAVPGCGDQRGKILFDSVHGRRVQSAIQMRNRVDVYSQHRERYVHSAAAAM